MKPLLLASLLLPLSTLAVDRPHYFAFPAGGAHDHGSVFQILQGKRTTLYEFCPDELYCLDGSTPLPATFPQPDGSVVGVTSGGGMGQYGYGGWGGVIYRLTQTTGGAWTYDKLEDLCLYWRDCDHFGMPIAVTSPKADILDIVTCLQWQDGVTPSPSSNCMKGLIFRYVIWARALTPLQRWEGGGS